MYEFIIEIMKSRKKNERRYRNLTLDFKLVIFFIMIVHNALFDLF